jgi:hypothetical protein
MDNLNEISLIWRSAKVDFLPTSDEIRGIAMKYRSQRLTKKIAIILIGILSSLVMVFALVSHKLDSLAARIGDVCILISCLVLIMANTRSLGRLYRLDHLSNKDFLQYLEKVQDGYIGFYKTNQVVGLAFNSVGLILYLFDFVHTSLNRSIVGYSLMILYLLLVWFVVRPWSFNRKMRKLGAYRTRLDEIVRQL